MGLNQESESCHTDKEVAPCSQGKTDLRLALEEGSEGEDERGHSPGPTTPRRLAPHPSVRWGGVTPRTP